MRAGRLLKARKDVIELLVRQGRLADIQLLSFFNMAVERECATPAAPLAVAAATAATSKTSPSLKHTVDGAPTGTPLDANKASASEEMMTQKVEAAETEAAIAAKGTLPSMDVVASLAALEATRAARQDAHKKFNTHLDTVRQTAVEKGPLEWLGQAYGTDTWSSSCLSQRSTHAHRVSAGKDKLKLHGVSFVSGGPGAKPTHARVVVTLSETAEHTKATEANAVPNAAGAPLSAVIATVKLDQPGVSSKLINGMLRLEFNGAEAAINADELKPSELAASQHLMNAAAYSGMLTKLQEVCALHATHAIRYDALLIRNPAVQMRLSQLACARYGIDSLAAYVLGDGEIDNDDEKRLLALSRKAVREQCAGVDSGAESADASALPSRAEMDAANAAALTAARAFTRLDIPLVESMVLNMYAETALMDCLDGAWALVSDTPLTASVPHRSNPAKQIDYPYIQNLFNAPKYDLTSNDGSMEMQAQEFLAPLLREAPRLNSGNGSNPLRAVADWANNLVGLSSGGSVRLAAPHVNLRVGAAALEDDLATLLTLVNGQADWNDPTFTIAVGQYMSEVFANLAVLYRCTAALNQDEDGKGHREWLLTEAFCASSKVRRERIMNDLQTAKAATKVLSKAADLDNYCTHPVELMNTAARKSAGPKNGSSDAAATA